jgi:SAM-dependent methyltransferase
MVDATTNLAAYNDPKVAAHYAGLQYLSACERRLFDQYLRNGMSILDLGVGGGRTTPYLANIASSYVGADYSDEMIRSCSAKFPKLKFLVVDASDLSAFGDEHLDAIILAFNAIDYVIPDEQRARCLGECHRCLRPGGLLIFSSHNPRAFLVRPAFSGEKVRRFARRFTKENSLSFWAAYAAAFVAKAFLTTLRSGKSSVIRFARRVGRRAFWMGNGYMADKAHGGLLTHYSVPSHVIDETTHAGFEYLQLLGDDYPRKSGIFTTDWYYYVFRKAGRTATVLSG